MMRFPIHETEPGRHEVDLGEDAGNCIALKMKPERLEQPLKHGLWLVLAFAVWSGPDREAIATAIEACRRLPGLARVAVRPFDSFAEFETWAASVSETFRTPIWLVLDSGELVAEQVGLMTTDELVDVVRSASLREGRHGE